MVGNLKEGGEVQFISAANGHDMRCVAGAGRLL